MKTKDSATDFFLHRGRKNTATGWKNYSIESSKNSKIMAKIFAKMMAPELYSSLT